MTGSSSPPPDFPVNFDLETYISKYEPKSETRLQRLLWIARTLTKYVDHSIAARDMVASAISLVESQLKENCDSQRYHLILQKSSSSVLLLSNNPSNTDSTLTLPETFLYDTAFVTQAEIASAAQLQKLEALLASAQAHLAKESIRSVHISLADFYRTRGDMTTALRYAIRTRDFCTNSRSSIQVYLLIIEILLHMGNYNQVLEYVAKADLLRDSPAPASAASNHHNHTRDSIDGAVLFSSQLITAGALARMELGHYRDAVMKLLDLDPGFTHQFHSIISAEDIALYGGTLALATMSRQELITHMLDPNSSFKERLELVPWLRDAIQHYTRAEFRTCLTLLYAKRFEFFDLDIRLHKHADTVLQLIRDKCLIQFFSPYSVVTLQSMADCIGTESIQEVELILANLILSGKMEGVQINSWTQTLHSISSAEIDRRRKHSTQRKVIQWGDVFLARTENALLRLSCMEHGISIRGDGTKSGQKKNYGKYTSYVAEEEMISRFLEKTPRLPWRRSMGHRVESDRLSGDDDHNDDDDDQEEEDVVMKDMD